MLLATLHKGANKGLIILALVLLGVLVVFGTPKGCDDCSSLYEMVR